MFRVFILLLLFFIIFRLHRSCFAIVNVFIVRTPLSQGVRSRSEGKASSLAICSVSYMPTLIYRFERRETSAYAREVVVS
ncbi:hypothetical protein CPB83DRAFT_106135 [Crepidotus variabilis]|uniref:Secreted protein n=1 Tax=Crepidotus variabilis TaxID=179855 RepID=A0A9P6JT09_9AGAR|nr:hypothetical protein CPB83DRAFT_106135 [Crepidotus variabilis]